MDVAHDAAPWQAWSPGETAARLEALAVPWGVTAGWALELFVGESWRAHEDLEIAIPDEGFETAHAALAELEFWVPVGDRRLRPLEHEPAPASHQTWGLDRVERVWRLDVFREPSDGGTWICRRDTSIRLPYADLLERTPDGVPFVRPEVVLLFKAKRVREKDAADFEAVSPLLGRARREWLRGALLRVHPAHAWLDRL